ncbi:MAG TPA: hypothetical protein ENJ32_01540 [Crenotrichaceae bacterium]|nr:hypothetical protein [Crenotrichaceae bacterium]
MAGIFTIGIFRDQLLLEKQLFAFEQLGFASGYLRCVFLPSPRKFVRYRSGYTLYLPGVERNDLLA